MALSHDELLQQIHQASGRRVYEIEAGQGGLVRLVWAGAVDASGRVAWIEFCNSGYEGVPTGTMLRIAGGGRVLCELELDDDCSPLYRNIHRLSWQGDHVIAICDLSRTLVASISASGGPAKVWAISHRHAADENRVVYVPYDTPGVLEALSLPDLRPLLPIPLGTDLWGCHNLRLSGGEIAVEAEGAQARLALPPPNLGLAGPELAGDVERALTREAAPGALPLVVACALGPFWITTAEPRPLDPEPERDWLHWFPLRWYQHLQARGDEREASALLSLLDDLATDPPETGWGGSVTALAARHVRRMASLWARACRAAKPLLDLYDATPDYPEASLHPATPPIILSTWGAFVADKPLLSSR